MKSLQDLIDAHENLVDHFYHDTVSQFHQSRTDLFAAKNLIQPEYTNWRDEQQAIRETCLLLNQSHHMPVLYIAGPDAKRMLQYLSPCTFSNLATDRAKQYFACTPRGHHIGDCVLYYYGEEAGFELVSGMPLLNWVRFHGESGDFDVEMTFDPTTPFNPTGGRTKFRFQLEGPTAQAVLDQITDGGWPELKFFRTARVRMADRDVTVLRHGMGSVGGAEISGDYADLEVVRQAILEAGAQHGLREGGTKTYFSSGIVSGWVPYPLPGIYTGEELRPYREWLPADSWEARMQLGGSLRSDNIEDYYWTPSALGYDRFVKFDHDFIGRKVLEAARSVPRRVRRILKRHKDDIVKVHASQFDDGPVYKSIELPTPIFGWPQADEVRSPNGELIGMSQYCAYTINDRDLMSVSSLDEDHAEIGSQVLVTWGEPDGGSRKPHVEHHVQTTIRATVCAAPYGKFAQELKRSTLTAQAEPPQ
ncbi:aminomethyltransferase family protein [Amycolatopsis pithecellobii]|uniref:Aminomethyl transferase family protein n=1 Tax=Amycolatopsis pithecellobii TaxID=664692 RepID=A0A6N7YTW0_9PSEU|nr:aminomethyltransferase family protein [Amycolatopsis pithecellobii]MTD56485.1 aminomethyl transferase family protein [Amycolatopsis pithecellobii]